MTTEKTLKPHTHVDAHGNVLILKRLPKNRTARNDFVYPEGVGQVVEAKDWNSNNKCGGGLHGWPLGFGIGEGSDYSLDDVWLILAARPEDVVGELEGGWKCKCRKATIVYDGTFSGAMNTLRSEFTKCVQAMAAANTETCSSGDYSQLASSGNYSQLASSGYDAKLASSGNCSQLASSGYDAKLASSGNCSQLASSGNYSQLASSGYDAKLASSGDGAKLASSGSGSSLEITGMNGVAAISGVGGKAKVSKNGAFALAYFDSDGKPNFAVGIEGVNVEAGKWYQVVNGKLEEFK